MFHPETEDMLPRAAPKPSAAPDEVQLKPMVPELSMLFGIHNQHQQQAQPPPQQQQPTTQIQQSNPTQMKNTYAAWKKQTLPKVRYSSSEIVSNDPLYTMRAPVSNVSPMQQSPEPRMNVDVPPFYRRSLDNIPVQYSSIPNTQTIQKLQNPIHTTPPNSAYQNALIQQHQQQQQFQQQQQRRSLEIMATIQGNHILQTPPSRPTTATSHNHDVLTICAGTQTDTYLFDENISPQIIQQQFVNRKDFDKLYFVIQEIRENQLKLFHLCENMLQQKQQQQQIYQSPTYFQKQDNSTQYEAPIIENKQKIPLKPINPTLAMFQSPQNNPVAQSTVYNTNTQIKKLENKIETPKGKPGTDKSLFMNELALKYLPNEKLNELLSDLQLSAPKIKALENIVATSKSPNEMSNASYKYLKKYRLLPDEQQPSSPTNVTMYHETPSKPTNTTQLENIDSDDEQNENNILDLENIRHEPKLL